MQQIYRISGYSADIKKAELCLTDGTDSIKKVFKKTISHLGMRALGVPGEGPTGPEPIVVFSAFVFLTIKHEPFLDKVCSQVG